MICDWRDECAPLMQKMIAQAIARIASSYRSALSLDVAAIARFAGRRPRWTDTIDGWLNVYVRACGTGVIGKIVQHVSLVEGKLSLLRRVQQIACTPRCAQLNLYGWSWMCTTCVLLRTHTHEYAHRGLHRTITLAKKIVRKLARVRLTHTSLHAQACTHARA